jgi:acyl dehydratase
MTQIANRPFDTIQIVDFCKRVHEVSEEDLLLFARANGYLNPLHLDDKYTVTRLFKQRIPHDMFTGRLIFAALTMDLP